MEHVLKGFLCNAGDTQNEVLGNEQGSYVSMLHTSGIMITGLMVAILLKLRFRILGNKKSSSVVLSVLDTL